MKTIILALVMILAQGPSIEVESGKVKTIDKKEIEIGKGTFIPDPHDKAIAKKLVGKDSVIKRLRIELDTERERSSRLDVHWKTVEDGWKDKVKAKDIEIMVLKGWWNRYGKTIIWCVVAAGTSAIITYGLVDQGVIK
ncbi:MAG: hypothetical protein JRI71_16390 [Deltaproteobacteria bacterium]|nr:hypothetical protein [Deltaproteobacteria bacterium]